MYNNTTEYNQFVRSAISDVKTAKGFLRKYLPEPIQKIIDFETIEPQKESFIEYDLRDKVADMLYSVNFRNISNVEGRGDKNVSNNSNYYYDKNKELYEKDNRKGYIYVLIERQNPLEELIAWRLLKYIIAIITNHLNKTKEKVQPLFQESNTSQLSQELHTSQLQTSQISNKSSISHISQHPQQSFNEFPIVIPLLFYLGDEEYEESISLFDLFGDKKPLAMNIFLKPYKSRNINRIEDEELNKQNLWSRVMMRTMKHVCNDEDIMPFLKEIVNDLRIIEKQERGVGYVLNVLEYIMKEGKTQEIEEKGIGNILEGMREKEIKEEFIGIIKRHFSKQIEDKIMTIVELYKKEGIKEGFEDGFGKGIDVGFDQGTLQGKMKGITEEEAKGRLEAIKIITMRLLETKTSISQISKITGLSKTELNELIKEMPQEEDNKEIKKINDINENKI